MVAKDRAHRRPGKFRWYPGVAIPLSVIRRFARQVGEHFGPDRIILFGSYAYGRPHANSDVDLLVVMPARNVTDQAIRIRRTLEAPFPLDLIVRTPRAIARGLREGDWFLRDIVNQGKVIYEAPDQTLDAKGRGRLSDRANTSAGGGAAP